MEREPGKMTGFLKYNIMESAAKASKGSSKSMLVMGCPMLHPKLLWKENFTLILMLIIPHPGMMMTQPQTHLPVTLLFWK